MNIRPFLEKLPSLYTDWGTTAMQPKTDAFGEILEQVKQPTTANFLQLLSAAAEYLETGETLCEIGCLAGANLIGVLANHNDRLAYGVDYFSTEDEIAEENIELLQANLESFGVLEQVCFAHQTVNNFFADLTEAGMEDRFGLYVYNFEPNYRQVLMSLLLARDFLADQALIIVNNTDIPEVRRAVADFLTCQPSAKVLLDWQSIGKDAFGYQGLGIISWDAQNHLENFQPMVIQEARLDLSTNPENSPLGNNGEKKVPSIEDNFYQGSIHSDYDDSPVNLYLDLMKKSLMNLIYDNDTDMMRGGNSYNKELKIYGGIWPSLAHTMIGLPRLNNIQFCMENILTKNIPGDCIETGVWRGGATIFMRSVLKAYGIHDRKVWVADSFEGLPPTEYKDDLKLKLNEVDCLAISMEEVQLNFDKYGLLDEQVLFLKGWFKDTLPVAPIKELAVIRLDGDWYESTMDALINLYPKLSIGGYVIIDDYWAVQGCQDAVHDYRRVNHINEQMIRIDNAAVYWCRLN
jgi:hypothetical protein